MDLGRRDLLKVLGVSVTAAAVPGCQREAHNLIPFLLPDEEIVPGVANWYASVCRECEAGCGTLVRVMEGRAKKIEGNPEHPLNRGKLCARGQAALQALYNPDRVRTPLKRIGPRGDGRFEPLSWPEAMDEWLRVLRAHPGAALIARVPSGSDAVLLDGFMKSLGGRTVIYSPEETVAIRAAMQRSFGVDGLPRYDLGSCDYLLSMGAPFLEHWLSPVTLSIGYGEMRQGHPTTRGRFVHVEPRLSLTAANADRWVPIRPGMEGLLLMGLIHAVLEERPHALPTHERSRWAGSASLSPADVARQTEIAEEDIRRLARELMQASRPLVLAGGSAASHTNGSFVLAAANALNRLLGAVNREGGLWLSRAHPLSAGPRPAAEQQVLDCLTQVNRGGALHLYDADLLHLVPDSFGVREALKAAPFIVSFSAFLDDTSTMADLVLPVHTPLESWGDRVYEGETSGRAAALQQPVVQPLYETRPVADLVLDASRRLGRDRERPAPSSALAFLRERWRRLGVEEDHAWMQRLEQGGWWEEEQEPAAVTFTELPPYQPAEFDGDPGEFPFFFHPFPSLGLHRGEGANRPWLQELPDPLTTAVWGTWIEINPTTARQLGLKDGAMAKVVSPYGSLEAPVIHYPGIRPDLVSIPLGQGHCGYGRYAGGRGVNPLSLLAPRLDRDSGRIASGATRVRVEPSERAGRIVRLIHHGGQPDERLLQIGRPSAG
ncbi:molybdopterin-containing oxidoreductase family protein [Candidatus Nitrospira bockiana]